MNKNRHDTIQIIVPSKIKTKEELLFFLSKELEFPSYFGNNWDALNDCLCDLQWLGQKVIKIEHENGFALTNSNDFEIYRNILCDVTKNWLDIDDKKIEIDLVHS